MPSLSKTGAAVCAALFACACVTAAANAASSGAAAVDPFQTAEAWAFPKERTPDPSLPKQAQAAKPDMNAPMHVPGSTRTYTRAQLDSDFFAADWFPQDHPPMPHIVAFGHKPAYACAACHKPGGEGYPASASLAGLPAAYIREQLQAFRDGQRYNDIMPMEARNLDAVDEQAVVKYFSSLKFASHVKVVETATVPKTHWDDYLLTANHDGAREPLGERIIEIKPGADAHGSERAVYTAYVPQGSIERGAVIAAKGVQGTPACESCHGAKLQGVGDIPYLAGRSPTYIARELILLREGKRMNAGAAPMRTEISHLTLQDMIDVAAYAASQKP